MDMTFHKLKNLINAHLDNFTTKSDHDHAYAIIEKCQNEILSADPNSYYVKAYKAEEIGYWQYIPVWIYQRNKRIKIEKCLDIGCAYGTLSLFCKKISNCEVYCTDYIDNYLSKTIRNNYNFHFEVNNIERDQAPWNFKYDAIIFTEVLEHLNCHPLPTLKKIRDLLSEDGSLYISTPDAASSWGRIINYYKSVNEMPYPSPSNLSSKYIDGHIYQYDENEIIDLADKAGFTINKLKYSQGSVGRHINLK